jgi:hypothetical protein
MHGPEYGSRVVIESFGIAGSSNDGDVKADVRMFRRVEAEILLCSMDDGTT